VDDFVREGETYWDGVRNYQARNNLRAMKQGDLVFFYHSVSDKEIVGVAKVTREHYPDPTAKDGDWSVVDLAPAKPMKQPVSLTRIKADKSLENIALIKQSLLSVMPSPRRSSAASSSWARPSCADAAPGQAAQPNNSPSPKKRLSSAWPFSTESEA